MCPSPSPFSTFILLYFPERIIINSFLNSLLAIQIQQTYTDTQIWVISCTFFYSSFMEQYLGHMNVVTHIKQQGIYCKNICCRILYLTSHMRLASSFNGAVMISFVVKLANFIEWLSSCHQPFFFLSCILEQYIWQENYLFLKSLMKLILNTVRNSGPF